MGCLFFSYLSYEGHIKVLETFYIAFFIYLYYNFSCIVDVFLHLEIIKYENAL